MKLSRRFGQLVGLCTVALVPMLTACGPSNEKDNDAEEALEEAGEDIEDGAEEVGDEIEDGADEVEDELD